MALALGESFPTGRFMAGAMMLGVLSYGVSILLDAYALRLVGAAREAAYFAMAPFFGALGRHPALRGAPGVVQLSAAGCMAVGAWMLLHERHQHLHVHDAVTHEHVHVHDDHHRHDHPPDVAEDERHSHVHTHAPFVHDHPHVSDTHHRHRH
jgi:hypothetical protein